MAKKKKNQNFRLGLNRQRLIEASIIYGKSPESTKKSNTANLEKFVIRNMAEKGTKVPELNDAEKREIIITADKWGTKDALKKLTYRIDKIAGAVDDENFIRLTMNDNFSLFYDGVVTREHVDELISRLPSLQTQVDSEMINIGSYYRNLFLDYADELKEREEQEKERKQKAV